MTEWNAWGAPARVRIEPSAVWQFARAVKDRNPAYASSATGTPVPPTFTFVMRHGGEFPDLQKVAREPEEFPDMTSRGGLYLHGEQEFVYHRVPVTGDVLDGRMRTSLPETKARAGGDMEITYYETVWSDPDGTPVVTERITSLWLPDPPK